MHPVETHGLTHVLEDMTEEEYKDLLDQSKHIRGFNGESSYYEQLSRGFIWQPVENNGVYINAVYRHYKGNEYLVTDVVADCETRELVVIYEALYDNEVSQKWSRRLSSFLETLPDGTARFALKNAPAIVDAIGSVK